MGLSHFKIFMNRFADEYNKTYGILENLGDYFYLIQEDKEFEKWLGDNKNLLPRRQNNVPLALTEIETKSHVSKDRPLYSIALNEFFYDEFEYLDVNNQVIPRKHGCVSQKIVSNTIHVPRVLITSWKSGSRCPGKYEWWALGIQVFQLDYQLLLPYLYMIGETVNASCLDDLILFYGMCAEKEANDIYKLLNRFGCEKTALLFAPS